MYSKWRGFCGILTLAVSLIALGCGSTGNTFVRVVNASPGLSTFTVYVNVTGVASSLPYGTEGVQPKGDNYSVVDTSGNYRLVAAGANQTVSVAGAPGSAPFTKTTQSLLKNGEYTIVSIAAAPSIQLQILTDINATPPSGEYQLRFMDTSTRASAIDVYITTVGGSVVGHTPVIGNINFQGVVTNPQPSPGTLELQITPHGNQANVLAKLPFSPAAGKDYSVFFLDPPNNGSLAYGILVVNDPISTGTTM